MRAVDLNEKLRVCFGEVWEREATKSDAWLIWKETISPYQWGFVCIICHQSGCQAKHCPNIKRTFAGGCRLEKVKVI